VSLGNEAASWWVELEWPEEVVGFLEVSTAGGDFVDQIFETDETLLAEVVFDDFVVDQWESLSVGFAVTSLVDQFSDESS